MALFINRGWQKFNAIRHALGGTTARSDHFKALSDAKSNEFGPFCATGYISVA